MRRVLSLLIGAAVAVSVGVIGGVTSSNPASAASASQFDPGNLITDGLFFDGSAMSSPEVQNFLQSQVPTCATYHAGYQDNQPPFTCLKDYRTTNTERAADAYCGDVPAGDHSAADIITLVGQACGISQKVLIVLLQKEQSLVTDTWPWAGQYRSATGYGCPDTAACDSRYYGFFNQVYMAARAFKYYTANPGQFRYHASQWNSIQYSPNANCGTASVYIQNSATAALYIYTPYAPNAAALANLYGTGDGCSSYGNRNFWRIYSDWFGSPTDIVPSHVSVSRVSGSERYASSAAISAKYFTPGVPVAYVASGENFPDAVSAGPAAAKGGGPVLLVAPNAIPPVIAAELARLHPARIVVVGGTASVSDAVLTQLGQYSSRVDRVGGADRYATSRALLLDAFGSHVSEVYLATGDMFADALSASASAGFRKDPILLVPGNQAQLDAESQSLLTSLGVKRVFIAGGTGVVSAGIEQGLAAQLGAGWVVRLAGSDRYGTSNAVNLNAFAWADTFFVASGDDFPDALSAAPVAAMTASPLYVTQPTCVSRAMVQHMISAAADYMVVIGGTGALTDGVARFSNC